jgi:hypothetical protein
MSIEQLTPTKLRHFCRNPRCRLKLPEPVENSHAAFCTKGCWLQYHRKRCCVCERPIEQPKGGGERRLCKRRVCRLELDKWPAVYLPFGQSIQKQETASRNAGKTAFSSPRSLRRAHWQRIAGEDEDYDLNGKGKMVARIRQEGAHWWVAAPRSLPDPPLETLDNARRRALSMALMAMPSPLPDPNPRLIAQVRRERELYPWRFSDAGERNARAHGAPGKSPLCEPLPAVPAPGIVPAAVPDADDPLAVPEFLIRSRETAEAAAT